MNNTSHIVDGLANDIIYVHVVNSITTTESKTLHNACNNMMNTSLESKCEMLAQCHASNGTPGGRVIRSIAVCGAVLD